MTRILLRRPIFVVGAVLALVAALLVTASDAAAASPRLWTVSGTFDDGGTIAGTLTIASDGSLVDSNFTTSGGDTATFGVTTSYTGVSGTFVLGGWYVWAAGGVGIQYVQLQLPDTTGAAEGDSLSLPAGSWECTNCSAVRYLTSGSITAGALLDTAPATTSITLDPNGADGAHGWYVHPVTVSVSATDDGTGVADTRCALDPDPAPASFGDLAGSCDYLAPGASVTTDGNHTLYAASTDNADNAETPVSASFAIDQTAPSLAPSFSSPIIYLHQSGVIATPNATDTTSGVDTQSCGAMDTSTAGDNTVNCTATDVAGNTTSLDVHYTVQNQILGFFSPAPRSKWKAGKTVPVKIALSDVNGVRIPDPQAAALVSGTTCRVRFSAVGAQPKTPQCMKYDASSHQFVYNWALARNPTGPATITITISYPDTTVTTTKSTAITITS
jgi:hypothetical protein